MEFLLNLIKPLMNQRGAVGDQADATDADAPDPNAVTLDENGFIPGTSYKSVAELIKGHSELKGLKDRQANELGETKAQLKTVAELAKEAMGKGTAPAKPADNTNAPDYDKEIKTVHKELRSLKYDDPKFEERQADLVDQLTDLKSARDREAVIKVAGQQFQNELSIRDQKEAVRKFNEKYPEFKTPEVQAQIDDFIAKDETGMHDKMSAFLALRGDNALTQANQFAQENAEIKKILALDKGKDATGKVLPKGQAPGKPTNITRLSGKERDAAMEAALVKLQ